MVVSDALAVIADLVPAVDVVASVADLEWVELIAEIGSVRIDASETSLEVANLDSLGPSRAKGSSVAVDSDSVVEVAEVDDSSKAPWRFLILLSLRGFLVVMTGELVAEKPVIIGVAEV